MISLLESVNIMFIFYVIIYYFKDAHILVLAQLFFVLNQHFPPQHTKQEDNLYKYFENSNLWICCHFILPKH